MAKCAECGFLSLVRGDGELIAADGKFRKEAVRDIAHTWGPMRRITDATPRRPDHEIVETRFPRCLVRPDVDFSARIDARTAAQVAAAFAEDEPWTSDDDHAGRLVSVMADDGWECSEWFPWEPGRTPKDHLEMRDLQRMIAREDERERQRMAFEEQLVERANGPQKWLVAIAVFSIAASLLTAIVPLFRDPPAPIVNNTIQLPAEPTATAIPPTPDTEGSPSE